MIFVPIKSNLWYVEILPDLHSKCLLTFWQTWHQYDQLKTIVSTVTVAGAFDSLSFQKLMQKSNILQHSFLKKFNFKWLFPWFFNYFFAGCAVWFPWITLSHETFCSKVNLTFSPSLSLSLSLYIYIYCYSDITNERVTYISWSEESPRGR